MSYPQIAAFALGAGIVAALICLLLHRLLHHETFRRYHEVGYAVFLQLGVVFAVLLAFVFNNVWSEYNIAAQAVNQECASLHGVAILGDRLPVPARGAVFHDLHAYLETVVNREWPDMQHRRQSRAAINRFVALWQTVATIKPDAADSATRSQMLSLLATAHQSRETRIFQMTQGVPDLIWTMLVLFAVGLVGCMLVFAAEASTSKAVFVGFFAGSLTLALVTVHVLDFPFESALQLTSHDFVTTLGRVEQLRANTPDG